VEWDDATLPREQRLAAASSAAERTIFVSAAAAPGGDGSKTAQYHTLPAAQAAARALLAAGEPMAADLTVLVGPGAYYQRAALRFTAADSGRDGFRVRWQGPGPAAGLTSGVQVRVEYHGAGQCQRQIPGQGAGGAEPAHARAVAAGELLPLDR